MLSTVKKNSFNENTVVSVSPPGPYAIVKVSTDPPNPTVLTVTIKFTWPPNLLGANVIVSPPTYPDPPNVTPTPPETLPGCPTSLRTRLIVNSAPVPEPDVDVCVTS